MPYVALRIVRRQRAQEVVCAYKLLLSCIIANGSWRCVFRGLYGCRADGDSTGAVNKAPPPPLFLVEGEGGGAHICLVAELVNT